MLFLDLYFSVVDGLPLGSRALPFLVLVPNSNSFIPDTWSLKISPACSTTLLSLEGNIVPHIALQRSIQSGKGNASELLCPNIISNSSGSCNWKDRHSFRQEGEGMTNKSTDSIVGTLMETAKTLVPSVKCIQVSAITDVLLLPFCFKASYFSCWSSGKAVTSWTWPTILLNSPGRSLLIIAGQLCYMNYSFTKGRGEIGVETPQMSSFIPQDGG